MEGDRQGVNSSPHPLHVSATAGFQFAGCRRLEDFLPRAAYAPAMDGSNLASRAPIYPARLSAHFWARHSPSPHEQCSTPDTVVDGLCFGHSAPRLRAVYGVTVASVC